VSAYPTRQRASVRARGERPAQPEHRPEEAGDRGGDEEHADRDGHERELAAQVPEEGAARRQAHGVDEEREPERLHERETLAEPRVERAEGQADEQRAGRAEPDRAERDGPERGAQPDDDEDRQQGRLGQDVEHGGHVSAPPRPRPGPRGER